jgi:hypothetical protein
VGLSENNVQTKHTTLLHRVNLSENSELKAIKTYLVSKLTEFILFSSCTMLLDKLTVVQIAKDFTVFHGSEGSHDSASGPYSGIVKSKSHTNTPKTYFCNAQFNITPHETISLYLSLPSNLCLHSACSTKNNMHAIFLRARDEIPHPYKIT